MMHLGRSFFFNISLFFISLSREPIKKHSVLAHLLIFQFCQQVFIARLKKKKGVVLVKMLDNFSTTNYGVLFFLLSQI